ncbi:MAG: hypothetical protein ABUT20_61365, partial [Bacteroidota bacterium]
MATSIIVRPLTYNCSQTDTNKIQFDVYVKNTGEDSLGFRSHVLRFTMKRGILPTGVISGATLSYLSGTGDPRLAALQTTYSGPLSFTISSTVAQINLGSAGTIYDNFTSPRFGPGDSLWLGTFRATSPVRFNCDSITNPSWVTGTPTSITVFDVPPFIFNSTACNSNGTGLSTTSGKLENGIVSTNNPTGAGSLPCSILLSCGQNCPNPPTVNAGPPQTICSSTVANLSGIIGGSASSAVWSATSGSFTDPNSLTTAYFPAISSGTVVLTLTTNDPDGIDYTCIPSTSSISLTIDAAPTVNAGSDQSVCLGESLNLSGSIGGSATSATWS